MAYSNGLTVLNASAGSGKTYSLVKAYIITLLKSEKPNKYRHLLAVTFTNKAVKEMKERVLETLYAFSNYTPETNEIPSMLIEISNELGLSEVQICKKASQMLNSIIHNYAAFDIVTIDTFTHRILRTFSKDLEITGNFEVSLDVKGIHSRAVDALITRAGTEKRITDILVNYALQKADEDKSWDISHDLNDIARLLASENDAPYLKKLRSKNLDDFDVLKKELGAMSELLISELKTLASQTLDLIHGLGLEAVHFSGKYFYNHLVKLKQNPFDADFNAKWKQDIDSYSFYKKAEKQSIKDDIDRIKDQLIDTFKKSRTLYHRLHLLAELVKKIVPLSVLQLINLELQKIKDEENILLISDFNALIHKSLREQPAAFIYERIGERYTNYFIDEFQDTSVVQWHNLIPLIENALSSDIEDPVKNSLLLVGDPKQAIYRWRGGKAEQFIDLSQKKHPFSTEDIKIDQLKTNYRSYSEVIRFNNSFFSYLSRFFDDPSHTSIYLNDNNQKYNPKEGGFVSIQFIEAKTVVEAHELYPEKVLEIITRVTSQGYAMSDLCILTRNNKDGTHLAQYLSSHDIQVISSESLLIHSSPVVQFIHALLELLLQPDTPHITLKILRFLVDIFEIEDIHAFYDQWAKATTSSFLKGLEQKGIYFSQSTFESLSLYEAIEYLIRTFHLEKMADAYVLGYLNVVFEHAQKNNTGLTGFLLFWEEKKDTLSIVAPEQNDAVQLMSIHKSKGLEFKVVIYPYADSDIYNHQNEHHWYKTDPKQFNGFEYVMMGHHKGLMDYGDQATKLFEQRKSRQQFDAINILYVALTRAIERVYVISRFRESVLPKTFSELFVHYLKEHEDWEGPEKEYLFGHEITKETPEITHAINTVPISFYSSSKEEHNIHVITKAGFLWNEARQNAITYGNIVHQIMAKIKFRSDIDLALEEAILEGLIPSSKKDPMKSILENIINTPELLPYYDVSNTIYNEQAILSSGGNVYIPDRIEILQNGEATIIDYKTGTPLESHAHQIKQYAQLLKEMDISIRELFLVYINNEVSVIKV